MLLTVDLVHAAFSVLCTELIGGNLSSNNFIVRLVRAVMLRLVDPCILDLIRKNAYDLKSLF